jgi:molybdopterin converting factor subunit 1
MHVRVLFFGALKDLAGKTDDQRELPDGATVADFLSLIVQESPAFGRYSKSLAIAVNQEYALPGTILHDQDEIGLLPPVSGGADRAGVVRQTRAFLVREKIEAEKVIAGVKAGADGAVVVFDGIVRDNSRGRRTIYLDYEAYEEMAVKELEALAEQALAKFDIRDLVVFHRLGRMYVGETSVLIVVASAHRAAAFDACRWFIDTLKKTVPIWKKEYFEDGAVWADGEPFPSDIGARK